MRKIHTGDMAWEELEEEDEATKPTQNIEDQQEMSSKINDPWSTPQAPSSSNTQQQLNKNGIRSLSSQPHNYGPSFFPPQAKLNKNNLNNKPVNKQQTVPAATVASRVSVVQSNKPHHQEQPIDLKIEPGMQQAEKIEQPDQTIVQHYEEENYEPAGDEDYIDYDAILDEEHLNQVYNDDYDEPKEDPYKEMIEKEGNMLNGDDLAPKVKKVKLNP